MEEDPDFVTWASHEALSPHSIACLMLGVVPPQIEPSLLRPSGNPPPIPEEVLDLVDHQEWRGEYERIYRALCSGIENTKLSLMSSGQPSVCDAVEYLTEVGHRNRWPASFFEAPFYKAVRSKRPSRVDDLEARVATLNMLLEASEAALAKSGKGRSYTTRNLKWLDRAIDEFYSIYPEDCPTTKGVAAWIVAESKAQDDPVTPTAAKRIAAVLTPDQRMEGGRISRK